MYILPTISSYTPDSLKTVAFECWWYFEGDKQALSKHDMQTYYFFETRTKIIELSLKF